MRRTTPDLVAQRQSVYVTASRVLLALTLGYALWTNYAVFVGGNLPLTPIDLGDGSVGAGLFMLAVGDLILVLVLWFTVDTALLNLLHMLLRTGSGARRPIRVPDQGPRPASTAGRSPFAAYPAGQGSSTLPSRPGLTWPPPPAAGPGGR